MCAVASAADSVIVITKLGRGEAQQAQHEAPCPSTAESSSSSIRMLPWPCGLISATRRYIGSAPKSVRSTSTSVAIGDSVPAARNAMPG